VDDTLDGYPGNSKGKFFQLFDKYGKIYFEPAGVFAG